MTTLSASDRRLAFRLHRAQRALFGAVDRDLKTALGLGSAQLAALYYLQRHDGCLLKELSGGLALNNSAVTGVVNRMLRGGLVTRRPSPVDGRAAQVFLTARGRELAERSRGLLAAFNRELEADFSEAELQIVARFLDHVITRFGDHPPSPPQQGDSDD